MTAPDIVKNLVERFEQHRDSYRSGRYNETQLRRELELNNSSPRMPQEQEISKREIESTDRQIDTLVYVLYGLTKDEVKVVEGKE